MPKPPVVMVTVSRCPKCGSTERTAYHGISETPISGTDDVGNPITHIVRKRTQCIRCGQARIDRVFENRPPQAEA